MWHMLKLSFFSTLLSPLLPWCDGSCACRRQLVPRAAAGKADADAQFHVRLPEDAEVANGARAG